MLDEHLKLLGTRQRDRVTGLTGVVTSISFDLSGCIQAALQQSADKDGKIPDGRWFDLTRLETDGDPALPAFDFSGRGTLIAGPADKPPK